MDACETRSGEDGTHTPDFYGLSQEIVFERINKLTDAQVDQMSFSVTMELEPAIAVNWWNTTGILRPIVGVFSGGAALVAVFGVGSLVCCDTTKSPS